MVVLPTPPLSLVNTIFLIFPPFYAFMPLCVYGFVSLLDAAIVGLRDCEIAHWCNFTITFLWFCGFMPLFMLCVFVSL